MRMTVKPGGLSNLRQSLAIRLQYAATDFITEYQKRVGISNPNPFTDPSKPGEYPKKRTGHGQGGITFEPADVAAIEKDLSMKIGMIAAAFYMEALVEHGQRLGLKKTGDDLWSRMAQILAGYGELKL